MERFLSLVKNTGRSLRLVYGFAPAVMVSIFAISIIMAVAPIYQAKILGDIVDRLVSALSSSIPLSSALILVVGYAAVWGAIRVAASLQLFFQKIWYIQTEHGLEMTVLKKRAEIDLGHYENPEFQNLLRRAFNQSFWPIFNLVTAQAELFGLLAAILVSSIVTSSISPLIYLIIIATSLPSFVIQFKYGLRVWTIWGEHSERQRKYDSLRHHLTGRAGVTQAKLLQNSNHIIAMISDILTAFKKDQLQADRRRFFWETGAGLLSAFGFGLSLYLLAKSIIENGQNVGSLVFMIATLAALVTSINGLLRLLGVQLEKNFYVTDIYTVLDTKPYIIRPSNPVRLDLTAPPKIEFKDVSFKYEGREDWILKDINLVIEPGEQVALVGMNGAGKSTLIKLLSRIYDPTEGDIFVNGVNLKEVDVDEWGSYISVLLQDYLNYSLIAKESIAMSRTDVEITEELVREASVHSGADEFISAWEKKYDQQLGKEFDGGIEPSKGQNQKIALARTLYRDALVAVLDEPTAAIDALSETQIFESMEKAVKGNTLILITHRFNTTQGVDKIIVLDKGTVVETGTHKELLDHNGLYAEMFESQAKAFRKEAVSENS